MDHHSPITLNLTSHGVERNSLAELVGISALAAESYGANTWFGDRERKVITLQEVIGKYSIFNSDINTGPQLRMSCS